MTKPQDLRALSVGELREKVVFLRKSLFEIREKAIGEKVEKPSQIRSQRKDIARIMTILKEKEKQA